MKNPRKQPVTFTQLQRKLSAADQDLAACLQSKAEVTSEQAALRHELVNTVAALNSTRSRLR